jgi:hypothetical protein
MGEANEVLADLAAERSLTSWTKTTTSLARRLGMRSGRETSCIERLRQSLVIRWARSTFIAAQIRRTCFQGCRTCLWLGW